MDLCFARFQLGQRPACGHSRRSAEPNRHDLNHSDNAALHCWIQRGPGVYDPLEINFHRERKRTLKGSNRRPLFTCLAVLFIRHLQDVAAKQQSINRKMRKRLANIPSSSRRVLLVPDRECVLKPQLERDLDDFRAICFHMSSKIRNI